MNYFKNAEGYIIPFEKALFVHIEGQLGVRVAVAPTIAEYFPIEQFAEYIKWLQKMDKATDASVFMDTFTQEALAMQKQGLELQKANAEVNEEHLRTFKETSSRQKDCSRSYVDIGNGELISHEMVEFIKTLVERKDV